MRLFVFVADKLLQWGRRVEQQAGYSRHEPVPETTCDPAVEPWRRDTDREAPPEHWARLVRSEPPPHWLELFRRATEAEQFFEDGASLNESVSLDAPEYDRPAVDGNSSEEQPRVETPSSQTPRNQTDYPANRERVRDRSRAGPPAVTPARFLDRLRFSAEPPATEKPEPDYVAGRPAEPGKPAVYPAIYPKARVNSRSESEPFSSPALPPSPHREQNNFPVRPPSSSQSNFLDFAWKRSKTAAPPAQTTVERIVAAERPNDRVQDNKRNNVSDARAQTDRHNRSREAAVETDDTVSSPDRYFSRDAREASRVQQPEYLQPEYLQAARRSSQERQPSLGPLASQSNNQQPATVSFVDSRSGSRIARVTVPAQTTVRPVRPPESSVKFGEQITGGPRAARRITANALAEDSQSHRRTSEGVSDPNKDNWPRLPPASFFDSDDDLFAREREAETLRRLEQEQRGTLWSE